MDGLVISDAVKDLIINIINIIILFVIVKTLAYKPVKKFLDARKAKIEDQLKEANEAKAQADAAAEQYSKLIADSKAAGSDIIRDAEKQAKQNADTVIENAKKTADGIIEKAKVQAKQEHDAALGSMKDDITDLAFGISARILSREVDNKDNMRIADEFFKEHTGSAE